MHWFKHYNTASQGCTLRTLWDNKDYEAYGLWWILLELISRWEKPENRGEITISWSVLARETNWKRTKCRRVLLRICSVSKIEMNEIRDGNVSFRHPNWLDLQENRGGKNQAKNEQNSGRSKKLELRTAAKPPNKNTETEKNENKFVSSASPNWPCGPARPGAEAKAVVDRGGGGYQDARHVLEEGSKIAKVALLANLKTLMMVDSRIREGHSLEALKDVICVKAFQWKKSTKMRPFITPETLFGPNFDKYVIEAQEARKRDKAISELMGPNSEVTNV